MKRLLFAIVCLVIILAVCYANRRSLARHFGLGRVEYGVDYHKLTQEHSERFRAKDKTIGVIESPQQAESTVASEAAPGASSDVR